MLVGHLALIILLRLLDLGLVVLMNDSNVRYQICVYAMEFCVIA